MLIAIVGSSKAGNDNLANALIHNYLSKLDPEKDTIVSGGGTGVDDKANFKYI